MTTTTDIRNLIESKIEDTSLSHEIAKVLKRFDGKKITKRIATAVEKALPSLTVFYDSGNTMYNLQVWGDGVAYDSRKNYLLGYHSASGTFSFEKFLDHNRCYLSAAEERNAQRGELLKDEQWQAKVADAIDRLNQARDDLENLVGYPNPDQFDLEKLGGLS